LSFDLLLMGATAVEALRQQIAMARHSAN